MKPQRGVYVAASFILERFLKSIAFKPTDEIFELGRFGICNHSRTCAPGLLNPPDSIGKPFFLILPIYDHNDIVVDEITAIFRKGVTIAVIHSDERPRHQRLIIADVITLDIDIVPVDSIAIKLKHAIGHAILGICHFDCGELHARAALIEHRSGELVTRAIECTDFNRNIGIKKRDCGFGGIIGPVASAYPLVHPAATVAETETSVGQQYEILVVFTIGIPVADQISGDIAVSHETFGGKHRAV